MRTPVPLTPAKLVLAIAATLASFALGALVLQNTYETWVVERMWLKPRGAPQYLITYAANPGEFVLRSAFMAALGGMFAFPGIIALLAVVVRLVGRNPSTPPNRFVRSLMVLLIAAPLICFVVLFFLLAFLPRFYQ